MQHEIMTAPAMLLHNQYGVGTGMTAVHDSCARLTSIGTWQLQPTQVHDTLSLGMLLMPGSIPVVMTSDGA